MGTIINGKVVECFNGCKTCTTESDCLSCLGENRDINNKCECKSLFY